VTSMSRRRFVGGSLGALGAAGAVSALPLTMQKALADVSDKPGSLSQIEHVIVFMQENRSFDTYFGALRGVRGFNDPAAITLPTGKPVWYQPDPKNPDGYELPFHLDTINTSAAAIVDLSHAWAVPSSWRLWPATRGCSGRACSS
jgi:phospholipase C